MNNLTSNLDEKPDVSKQDIGQDVVGGKMTDRNTVVEEVEEDWSSIMTSDLSAGTFAQHDHVEELAIVLNPRTDKKQKNQRDKDTDRETNQNDVGDDDENDAEENNAANANNTTRITATISIKSTVSLSPLDMMDLSWGRQDATGHRVWMGARFLFHALSTLCHDDIRNVIFHSQRITSQKFKKSVPKTIAKSKALEEKNHQESMHNKFDILNLQKNILELGTGTGLTGIAIAKLRQTQQERQQQEQERQHRQKQEQHILLGLRDETPGSSAKVTQLNHKSLSTMEQTPTRHRKKVILTDASDSALELCRQNVDRNNVSDMVQVEKLCWGDCLAIDETTSQPLLFDIAVAADVLYDITAWDPIIETVQKSLHKHGYFLLSHIPRAALPIHREETTTEQKQDQFLKVMTTSVVSDIAGTTAGIPAETTVKSTTKAATTFSPLEKYLINKAEAKNLSLLCCLRPMDLFFATASSFQQEELHRKVMEELNDMEQAGAAIFIFSKMN